MKSKQMNLPVLSLRMQPQLKEAIANRAHVENRTQTDLIREAVKVYLLKPLNQKNQDNLMFLSEFNQIQYGSAPPPTPTPNQSLVDQDRLKQEWQG